MGTQFTTSITYFLREGRENLRECLRSALSAAANHNIRKLIIFTAEGLGIRVALEEFSAELSNRSIQIIAVTFPVGKPFTDAEGKPLVVEIPPTLRSEMRERQIPVVRAHLPFDPIYPMQTSPGVLGQDLSLVSSALNVFGGSMSLCVQAILMACDAGEVAPGEHVISMTSDTAILAQAAPTANMLRGLAVREVMCKPAIYSIGRKESVDQLAMPLDMPSSMNVIDAAKTQILLPEKSGAADTKTAKTKRTPGEKSP